MLALLFLLLEHHPHREIGKQEEEDGAHLYECRCGIVQQIIVMPAQGGPGGIHGIAPFSSPQHVEKEPEKQQPDRQKEAADKNTSQALQQRILFLLFHNYLLPSFIAAATKGYRLLPFSDSSIRAFLLAAASSVQSDIAKMATTASETSAISNLCVAKSTISSAACDAGTPLIHVLKVCPKVRPAMAAKSWHRRMSFAAPSKKTMIATPMPLAAATGNCWGLVCFR